MAPCAACVSVRVCTHEISLRAERNSFEMLMGSSTYRKDERVS